MYLKFNSLPMEFKKIAISLGLLFAKNSPILFLIFSLLISKSCIASNLSLEPLIFANNRSISAIASNGIVKI